MFLAFVFAESKHDVRAYIFIMNADIKYLEFLSETEKWSYGYNGLESPMISGVFILNVFLA